MVLSWATKRKLIYLSSIVFVGTLVGGVILFSYFNKPLTCTDKIQNQEEEGIDCGGPCNALCTNLVSPLVIHWGRVFEVSPGLYDAAAVVENPNAQAGIRSIIYRFKLYDDQNVLIIEKFGKTFVGPREEFALFEGGLRTGERIPKRVFFEFAPEPEWVRLSPEDPSVPKLSVRDQVLSNIDTAPRLRATIANDSSFAAKNISVIVVLYDVLGNAIGVSSTHIEAIQKTGKESVSFTWQKPFSATPVRIDIIPRTPFLTPTS